MKQPACIATAVEDSARPPPRMMAPGPCTADSAVTVAAIAIVVISTCAEAAGERNPNDVRVMTQSGRTSRMQTLYRACQVTPMGKGAHCCVTEADP